MNQFELAKNYTINKEQPLIFLKQLIREEKIKENKDLYTYIKNLIAQIYKYMRYNQISQFKGRVNTLLPFTKEARDENSQVEPDYYDFTKDPAFKSQMDGLFRGLGLDNRFFDPNIIAGYDAIKQFIAEKNPNAENLESLFENIELNKMGYYLVPINAKNSNEKKEIAVLDKDAVLLLREAIIKHNQNSPAIVDGEYVLWNEEDISIGNTEDERFFFFDASSKIYQEVEEYITLNTKEMEMEPDPFQEPEVESKKEEPEPLPEFDDKQKKDLEEAEKIIPVNNKFQKVENDKKIQSQIKKDILKMAEMYPKQMSGISVKVTINNEYHLVGEDEKRLFVSLPARKYNPETEKYEPIPGNAGIPKIIVAIPKEETRSIFDGKGHEITINMGKTYEVVNEKGKPVDIGQGYIRLSTEAVASQFEIKSLKRTVVDESKLKNEVFISGIKMNEIKHKGYEIAYSEELKCAVITGVSRTKKVEEMPKEIEIEGKTYEVITSKELVEKSQANIKKEVVKQPIEPVEVEENKNEQTQEKQPKVTPEVATSIMAEQLGVTFGR